MQRRSQAGARRSCRLIVINSIFHSLVRSGACHADYLPPDDQAVWKSDEFEKIDYRVMGHAFACQNELGRLCEEDVYQRKLGGPAAGRSMQKRRNPRTTGRRIRGFAKTYFLDLIVDHAVYELKTTTTLTSEHEAQLLDYLLPTWHPPRRTS